MKKAVFFDMNETLLNLNLLKDKFDKYFTDEYILKYWFTKLLHTSTIMGIMQEYRNFGELSAVVLEDVFHERGKEITPETKTEILGAFKELPPYNDVIEALDILRQNNIRTVAVSNSSLAMIKEQLTNAGIIDLFDAYYSVDTVQIYKPFNSIYHFAAEAEHLELKDITMVASHDWDLFGAKKAGLSTAYIERKRTIFNPLFPLPDLSHSNLVDLAKEIVRS